MNIKEALDKLEEILMNPDKFLEKKIYLEIDLHNGFIEAEMTDQELNPIRIDPNTRATEKGTKIEETLINLARKFV